MAFWDDLSNNLGCRVGIYDNLGKLIKGYDIGFSFTDNISFVNDKTYINCDNLIISLDTKLSQDALCLVKLTYSLYKEKSEALNVDSLDYIIKNEVSPDSIKGKYQGYDVFYITSDNQIFDILLSIYEGYSIEIVSDNEGIYLISQMEDKEQEAQSIIDGIWQEAGVRAIIGCGRTTRDDYTIKDAAVHARYSNKIARALCFKEGFYSIDKLIVYGLIDSIKERDISFFIHGGFNGFIAASKEKELVDTAEQLFRCNLNISEAARNLFIHRNTLLYRIEKIKNLTGLDIKKFDDALIFNVILAALKLKGIG